jgi:hypothetical protein
MVVITFNALQPNPTFGDWTKVNKIILSHMRSSNEWKIGGYDGMATVVKEKFNVTINRDYNNYVTYRFDSEADYLVFLLSW